MPARKPRETTDITQQRPLVKAGDDLSDDELKRDDENASDRGSRQPIWQYDRGLFLKANQALRGDNYGLTAIGFHQENARDAAKTLLQDAMTSGNADVHRWLSKAVADYFLSPDRPFLRVCCEQLDEEGSAEERDKLRDDLSKQPTVQQNYTVAVLSSDRRLSPAFLAALAAARGDSLIVLGSDASNAQRLKRLGSYCHQAREVSTTYYLCVSEEKGGYVSLTPVPLPLVNSEPNADVAPPAQGVLWHDQQSAMEAIIAQSASGEFRRIVDKGDVDRLRLLVDAPSMSAWIRTMDVIDDFRAKLANASSTYIAWRDEYVLRQCKFLLVEKLMEWIQQEQDPRFFNKKSFVEEVLGYQEGGQYVLCGVLAEVRSHLEGKFRRCQSLSDSEVQSFVGDRWEQLSGVRQTDPWVGEVMVCLDGVTGWEGLVSLMKSELYIFWEAIKNSITERELSALAPTLHDCDNTVSRGSGVAYKSEKFSSLERNCQAAQGKTGPDRLNLL